MSSLNGQTMNPEFAAWLDEEIRRKKEALDKWYVAMTMEQGRKNGELETLMALRSGLQVANPPVEESPNGQVHETEVVRE